MAAPRATPRLTVGLPVYNGVKNYVAESLLTPCWARRSKTLN